TSCNTTGKTQPIAVYAHGSGGSIGCAVTGGYIYRGAVQPALQGQYILGDYCTGRIWTLYQDENVANLVAQGQFAVNVSSFGEGGVEVDGFVREVAQEPGRLVDPGDGDHAIHHVGMSEEEIRRMERAHRTAGRPDRLTARLPAHHGDQLADQIAVVGVVALGS